MATKAKEEVSTTEEVVEDVVDALEPEVIEKERVLGEGDERLIFVQKPLSFFGKVEFFSVLGKAVEKVLSDGGSITDILDAPDPDNPLGNQDTVVEANAFIRALSKVIQYAPEILEDLYCVILAVPRNQREYVKIRLTEDLTDEMGTDILDTFVDQNWEVMMSFFKERVLPLVDKISQKVRS